MSAKEVIRLLMKDKLGAIGIIVLLVFILIGIFAAQIIPYDPMQENMRPDGSLARMDPPSSDHWFGTNKMGRDVFSQVIAGTRVALVVGITSALMVTLIGTVIGLIAGYYGGWLDDLLMRITDIVYGIPFLPFAMIMVAVTGPSISNVIIAIVLISWRTTARVIRSEVLTLKERTFIQAAKLTGASNMRIIFRHIAPNILPLSLVFSSLAMGWAILTEASVSFLGYGDPMLISWGKILFDAYVAQAINDAWWWVLPPGLAITILVMAGFFVSRSLEQGLKSEVEKSMTENILTIQNLRTSYKTQAGEVWAVDGVDLTLAPGETLGLVGESGCGKTTIIKSILRLLPKQAYSTGEVLFKGQNLLDVPLDELRKLRWKEIAIISQSAMNALDPVYRVGDQIVEAVRLHSQVSKAEAWGRAEELFLLVGLDKGRLRDYPHQFSGGMRQRAIIAMALALNPSIVVADEPTTALDVIVQAQILRRIQQLQKELKSSMIMVTHDMSVVAETCQKVVVMYAGKVVESGPVEVIFKNPFHPYTMGLKNAFPSVKGEKFELISIPGYPPDLLHPPQGCRFADRCPFATEVCYAEQPPNTDLGSKHIVACHHLDRVEEMQEKASHEATWLAVDKEVS